MEIVVPGHIYRLNWLDGEPQRAPHPNGKDTIFEDLLIFVNREDNPHGGTQTQEVLRALIDRTMHCDNCLRWPGNDQIIYHLRQALVLHEARALGRKVEKGLLAPEGIRTEPDGHFSLRHDPTSSPDWLEYHQNRANEEEEAECQHRQD